MTKTDAKKFAEILAYLGTIFGKELTATGIKMYYQTLIDLEIGDIEKAAMHIANNRTITGTFPLPAEFREAVKNQSGELSVEEKAEVGWLALVWAIESLGRWASVQFEDAVIHDVVQALGGWLRITSADNVDWNTESQMTWRRKDFVAMYKIMARQRPSTPYLIGEQEAANDGIYHDFIPKITRVGGKPGQYITHQVNRVEALPGPESDLVGQVVRVLQ